MSELTPEAEQVLKYLVLNSTPEDLVSFDRIEQSTNLHGITLSDAIAELDEFQLIDTQLGHARPGVRAWEIAGEDVVGFDIRADALEVAHAVADTQDWVEAKQLEQMSGLPVTRLNIAVLLLHDEGGLELLLSMGTRPYAFDSVRATYQTRKWLRTISGTPQLRRKYNTTTHSDSAEHIVQAKLGAVPASAALTIKSSQPVFMSYRRDDSAAGHAVHLRADLVRRYGENAVFMDLSIEPGVDFVDTLENAVGSCAVLLAVIGRNWLTVTDAKTGNRRLDNPDDWVRVEVATALKRNIRVIPLLFHDAHMPSADDLPDDLKPLARRNPLEITNQRWDYDVKNLMKIIDKIVGFTEQDEAHGEPTVLPQTGEYVDSTHVRCPYCGAVSPYWIPLAPVPRLVTPMNCANCGKTFNVPLWRGSNPNELPS